MEDILLRLAHCVEFGKINNASPYPPDMKGQDGADELTLAALESGISAADILEGGLMSGMEKVGKKFRENKIFVPQVLMSAKSMNAAMEHLKPYFASGEAQRKGTFIIGTVKGDLHDIGKNLVSMMMEGNGYEVIDLGTDVPAEKFLEAIGQYPNAIIGLSALLTTTMASMEQIVGEIRKSSPVTRICIGGAPISEDFRKKINADFYSPDPQGLVEYLNV